MNPPAARSTAALLWLCFGLASYSAHAFELRGGHLPRSAFVAPRGLHQQQRFDLAPFLFPPKRHRLAAAADDVDGEQAPTADTSEESSAAGDDEVPAAEEKKEEDPELAALKQEIANLESALKAKKREVFAARDKADEFTKEGYARQVAEMENMRRARSSLNSSNRSASTAAILTEFLPALDRLQSLQSEYGNSDFGRQYGALPGALRSAFSELGATSYDLAVGDKVSEHRYRLKVVEERYSDDIPQGQVMELLRTGWELQGNVIRPAECIASLGPETAEEQQPAESNSGGGEGQEAVPDAK